MKNRFWRMFLANTAAFCVLAASVMWVSCKNNADEEEDDFSGDVQNYSKEFWGEWVRMDTGESWYISNNSIKIDGIKTSSAPSFTKQSERVIKAGEGGREFYLYASRTANASFTGKVSSISGARSAENEITAIDASNPALIMRAVVGNNGDFTFEDAIPGDDYELEINGEPTDVTPNFDGDDVGTITLGGYNGVNFKTTMSSTSDLTKLYAGRTYNIKLKVTNTGSVRCSGAGFSLEYGSNLTVTTPDGKILGSIDAGKYKGNPYYRELRLQRRQRKHYRENYRKT